VRDFEALSKLAAETYAAAFGRSFSPADLATHLEHHLSPENFVRYLDEDTILVAEMEARMIGFAQFGVSTLSPRPISAGDRDLRRLYVLSGCQNQGIGSALMAAALAHPDMQRAERIYLDVWEHNPGAQRFYARYGFETIGAHAFSVESGAETGLDRIMVRRRSRPGA